MLRPGIKLKPVFCPCWCFHQQEILSFAVVGIFTNNMYYSNGQTKVIAVRLTGGQSPCFYARRCCCHQGIIPGRG